LALPSEPATVQAAICSPQIVTSSDPSFTISMPLPTLSCVASSSTGMSSAFSFATAEANRVLSNPEPNAASGSIRTTESHAALTLAGLPSLGTTLRFQPATPAAFLIASAMLLQTSTPQWT
jgi:hypothetical protein